jgi:hypothetical protein
MNDERSRSIKPSAALAIFWGGLLCGVFDIVYAFALFGALGVRPVRLLQGIASGLLGASAFSGGLKTAAFGLFLHFVIAYGATMVYYLASRRLHFMVRQAFVAGLLYGVAVHVFMNFVVIPLSATAHRPFNLGLFVLNAFEHMLLVGLPISLSVRRFSLQPPAKAIGESFQQASPKAASA